MYMIKALIIFVSCFLFSIMPVYSGEIENNLGHLTKPLLRLKNFDNIRGDNDSTNRLSRVSAFVELNRFENESKSILPNLLNVVPEWKNIGPFDIGGRVRSIVVHPNNKNIVYAGAASGGVWKSTDGGVSWTPKFDFESASSFGALGIASNSPEIIYAATGEMIIGGGIPYLGNGIYKSTNGGDTWFQIGLTEVAAFSKFYVHSTNNDILYAAGSIRNGGLYISHNAGLSWDKKFDGNITDLWIDPQNPDYIVIGVNALGVFISEDGGKSWYSRSYGLVDLGGRVSVQAHDKNSKLMFALIERKDGRGAIFRSIDAGENWTMMLNGQFSFFNSQGYYNNFISISPQNPNIVLAGGIDLWRSTNSGLQWEIVNERTVPSRMHVDQHCAFFAASDPATIYVGNDGGVYKSTDNGFTWYDMNKGLMITQFYSMSLDLKEKNRNFGGTQDHGTLGNPSGAWRMLVGGDGFDSFLHPTNQNVLYGEIYYGDVFKYDISKNQLQFLRNGIPEEDQGIWHSPFVFDNKTHTMFLGRRSIYASYDYGNVFFRLTTQYNHPFTAIEPSKKNSRFIFAGNNLGHFFSSTDAGITWVQSEQSVTPGKYITSITSSNANDSVVYITFGGFGNKHLFKSSDIGKTWNSLDNNLPDIPINSLVIHPENEKIIFIGTDIGVFFTIDGGNFWMSYGENFPRTPVYDLKFHTNRTLLPELTLRAATYGRSIWEIEVPKEINIKPGIISPAGGEFFTGGSDIDMSWYGFDLPVKVELYNGEEFILIEGNVIASHIKTRIPDISTFNAFLKVTSLIDNSTAISKTFSISRQKEGSILFEDNLGFNTYGLAFYDNDILLAIDYRTGNINFLSKNDLSLIKRINIGIKGLFTDIAVDASRNIWIHKMEDEQGGGAEIINVNSNGQIIARFNSPAKYPMGITLKNDKLIVSERDGEQNIYEITLNDFQIHKKYKNPVAVPFGPRGLSFKNGNYHQVTTFFVNQALNNSEISVFDDKGGNIIKRIPLLEKNSIMNARGIDIDPIDGHFWVCNFTGGIFKIASEGINTSIGTNNSDININIFPNPASNQTKIATKKNVNINNIKITDLIGNNMLSLFDLNRNEINVDTSDFSQGLYLVEVTISGENPIILKLSVIR